MASPKKDEKEDGGAAMEEEEDDEDEIDEEQIEEFKDDVDNLGDFPDKVKISSLTMMAEDFSDSRKGAQMLYRIIRDRLMNQAIHEKQLLPLIYLIDSIVKNAKGEFISVVEADAPTWISHAWNRLRNEEPLKLKLQKVWKTWNDGNIFDAQQLKLMGQCFDVSNKNVKTQSNPSTEVAGISRTSDGSLILSTGLRHEMQNILDDMQSDVTEVDKISLERLAQINPKLLARVKQTALEGLRSGAAGEHSRNESSKSDGNGATVDSSSQSAAGSSGSNSTPFLKEIRTSEQMERAAAWADISTKTMEQDAPALVKELMGLVESCGEAQYTQPEAMEMTQSLAAASATAELVQKTLERIKTDADKKKNALLAAVSASSGALSQTTQPRVVDPNDFTNEGVKKKVPSVISMLYEVGLPFVSSTDGRRFRSQLELSKHLDTLFKKNQLEKSIAKTEERGWLPVDLVWSGDAKTEDVALDATGEGTEQSSGNDGLAGNTDCGDGGGGYTTQSMVPADEARDRCVICGINFKMDFDNENGMYMYSNCREIELLNDAEIALNDSEKVLAHVTCWFGLGAPDELTMDQVLTEALHQT
mmetsp:Transcript_18028/g.49086  ORF Transcript_18028/g.49086 Transcript_18028/m.49086 type:complete len:589 (+) Transcript_18028:111-1877(+)